MINTVKMTERLFCDFLADSQDIRSTAALPGKPTRRILVFTKSGVPYVAAYDNALHKAVVMTLADAQHLSD